jgi:serine/threonine protein kinase
LYSLVDSVWKLADFGYTSEETASRLRDTTTAKQAEIYRAPELALNQNFDEKSDIWSMGCILYEMVANKPAVNNDNALFEWYFQDRPFEVTIDNTFDVNERSIYETVIRMLQKEPSKRPSTSTLFNEFRHHWSTLTAPSDLEAKCSNEENGLLDNEVGNISQCKSLLFVAHGSINCRMRF